MVMVAATALMRGEHVERPDRHVLVRRELDPGEGDQAERREPAGDGADDQHAAPVEGVGEHPAPQPGDDHRDQRDAADQRDREGGLRDVVDLQADRDDGQLGADARDRGAEPEPRERRRFAQRA